MGAARSSARTSRCWRWELPRSPPDPRARRRSVPEWLPDESSAISPCGDSTCSPPEADAASEKLLRAVLVLRVAHLHPRRLQPDEDEGPHGHPRPTAPFELVRDVPHVDAPPRRRHKWTDLPEPPGVSDRRHTD